MPQPYPWGVQQLPPQPRRSYFWAVLTTLLVVSMLLALAGVAGTAWVLRSGGDSPTAVTWVDVRPEVGLKAIDEVLARHADAVKRKSVDAWMADVDQVDPGFVKRQRQEFENLTKVPFAELQFERTNISAPKMAAFLPSQLFDRYHAAVRVIAVTVRHRVEGVDTKVVATPWLAVFGYVGGRWVIAGDGAGKDMPTGAEGQPWDADGAITVVRDDRVVAVLSAEDADGGQKLLQLAEAGLRQVAEVRPTGWDGKVLLTAVNDKQIFDTYFAESPDRVAEVAAIAVPYYGAVAEWSARPSYATTRVVFNPTELSAPTAELQHDLTHEFTHAAMGPVTGPYTPRWVVEGFAEYVAYKDGKYNAAGIRAALGGMTIGTFPDDKQFYEEPRNYISGWLACRMIAETYGQDKLIAFYEAFMRMSEVESVSREVLGVGQTQLEQQWRDFVAQAGK
ncbi:hypothetical protein [Dactylosporangium darangshiense]|uniref:hypothetical protein n=1 Tax=Dactylosporangium darangshiense TaxID=579108 RepID=UPI0031E8A96C